jgi:Rap1a immunity proteins
MAALARRSMMHEGEFWMFRFCLVLLCGLGVFAASARAALPIDLKVRTAGDLAALCASDPNSPAADAKINFCHGFAQGAVDDRLRMAADKKPFCFPNPTPTRTATMREFVGWVRSSPANRDLPALDGLFKFFGERFPCKP